MVPAYVNRIAFVLNPWGLEKIQIGQYCCDTMPVLVEKIAMGILGILTCWIAFGKSLLKV